MLATTSELIDIADEALWVAQCRLAKIENGDPLDYPPSAFIACLLSHAEYHGWNFDAALGIARKFSAKDCNYIADSLIEEEE